MVQLKGELIQALRTDALSSHYQPIVDGNRIPIAVEALVRWPHSDRGLLSPAVIPVDSIKLDRQFITGIENHEVDRAIVRSAVDMAHATKRRRVAEGVETNLQFHLLHALGIDAYQGFLFARPLPNEDLHALLDERTSLPRQQQQ